MISIILPAGENREEFLEDMNQIISWQHWIDLIKVHYPSDKRGQPPRGIETIVVECVEAMDFRINVRPSSIKMSKNIMVSAGMKISRTDNQLLAAKWNIRF